MTTPFRAYTAFISHLWDHHKRLVQLGRTYWLFTNPVLTCRCSCRCSPPWSESAPRSDLVARGARHRLARSWKQLAAERFIRSLWVSFIATSRVATKFPF